MEVYLIILIEAIESWDTEGFDSTPAFGTLNASQGYDDLVLAQYGGDRLLFAYEDGNSQII